MQLPSEELEHPLTHEYSKRALAQKKNPVGPFEATSFIHPDSSCLSQILPVPGPSLILARQLDAGRFRAKREQLKWFQGLSPASQSQHLALTVLCVPH